VKQLRLYWEGRRLRSDGGNYPQQNRRGGDHNSHRYVAKVVVDHKRFISGGIGQIATPGRYQPTLVGDAERQDMILPVDLGV
jgi:hypothetical protein